MKSSKILILVAILLVLAVYILRTSKVKTTTEEVKDIKNASTTEEAKTPKITITDLTPKNVELPRPIPSLDRPLQFPSDLADDARVVIANKISVLVQALKKDPALVQNWIDLGVLQKIVRDYQGAKESWVYASRLNSKATTPHNNLADLYTYYLVDYSKAEIEWKTLITLDPKSNSAYRGLYELYHLSYKEKDGLAIGVLLDGLKINPKDIDLMILTASHYKGVGDKDNAKKYYDMALLRAKELNNPNLQKLIEDELKNL